jgi:hypothetical protein
MNNMCPICEFLRRNGRYLSMRWERDAYFIKDIESCSRACKSRRFYLLRRRQVIPHPLFARLRQTSDTHNKHLAHGNKINFTSHSRICERTSVQVDFLAGHDRFSQSITTRRVCTRQNKYNPHYIIHAYA